MRFAGLALVGLSLGVIVLALWTIGGPGQARAERRDMTRMQDLQELSHHVLCRHRNGADPATTPGATADCPAPERLADPFTNVPYRITVVGDRQVHLCAQFETKSPVPPLTLRGSFDPQTGCEILRLPAR